MLPRHRLTLTAQIDHRLGLAKLSAKNKPFLYISWLPRAFCDSNRKRMSKNLLSLLLCLGLVSVLLTPICFLISPLWNRMFILYILRYALKLCNLLCFYFTGTSSQRVLIQTQRRLSTCTFEQRWNKSELLEKSFVFIVRCAWTLELVLWFWVRSEPKVCHYCEILGRWDKKGGSLCLIFPLLWF